MSLDKTSNLHTSFRKLWMIKETKFRKKHQDIWWQHTMIPKKQQHCFNIGIRKATCQTIILYTPEICYRQYVVQIPGEVYLLLSGTSPTHFLLDFLILFPIHQACFWNQKFEHAHCWDYYCQGQKCCSCSGDLSTKFISRSNSNVWQDKNKDEYATTMKLWDINEHIKHKQETWKINSVYNTAWTYIYICVK